MVGRKAGSTGLIGAVLAGGHSRRMGRDKALLEVAGQPLLLRAVAVLESVIEEVVVVAPEHRGYATLGVEVVPDIRPDQGPLGGIQTALVRADGRPVFVLACDMPYVCPQLIRWLVQPDRTDPVSRSEGSLPNAVQARLVRDDTGLQPLCGLYGSDCRRQVEEALDEGRRSVVELVESLSTEVLILDPSKSWFRPDLLCNVNHLAALNGRSAPSRLVS